MNAHGIFWRIRHRIAHWLGWNCGRVETWWAGDRLMVGFRCECGKLQGIHPAHIKTPLIPKP